MTYDATVVKAFLASPGDVAEERTVARDVINEWNAVHSEDKGLVLLPVGWETHAAPEMGERAQAIINRQLLSSCDLLIAIFWTRLGTPTGESPSGTVEEIREHVRAGKPASVYFSNAPVRPDSVDEEQYRALRAFRKECEASGLLETFESTSEFRNKFVRQLAQTVIRAFQPSPEVRRASNGASEEPALAQTLSEGALELLRAGLNDPAGGSITLLRSNKGESILAGRRDFTEPHTARAQARWKRALLELEDAGIVEDLRGNRYLFEITHRGYELGDQLGLSDVTDSS
jgi:hypothetical protein